MLKLIVLLLELGDQGSVHLVQASNAGLICLDQAVLGAVEEITKVCEVLVLDLRPGLEDKAQESHQTGCRHIAFFNLLQCIDQFALTTGFHQLNLQFMNFFSKVSDRLKIERNFLIHHLDFLYISECILFLIDGVLELLLRMLQFESRLLAAEYELGLFLREFNLQCLFLFNKLLKFFFKLACTLLGFVIVRLSILLSMFSLLLPKLVKVFKVFARLL